MQDMEMLVDLGQIITVLIVAGGLIFQALSVGKAIGRIEQVLEAHHEDIRDLKDRKVDKETCEALRGEGRK